MPRAGRRAVWYRSNVTVDTHLLEDPQLRPFLPLLFVAWSDGDLDAQDLAALRAHVERMPWLRPAARIAIESWLDPAEPPTWLELGALRGALERVSGTLPPKRRRDLLALASSLAGEHRAAMAALEAVIGGDEDEVIAEGLEEAAQAPATFDVQSLRALLDGEHAAIRDRVRAFLGSPERRAYGLPVAAYREKVAGWLAELAKEGFGAYAYPGVTSGAEDMGPFFAVFETLAMGDLSLLVKSGVQFGLFGGSIVFLGRPEQRAAYLPRAASLELVGCFAMSEAGHGSDVQGLETEARWDAATRTFTIVTPRESARKDWIGGAAKSAHVATVFADLVEGDQHHGVHGFVVPIRNDDGTPCKGVRTGDCGDKMGLDGVDNGRLWFDHVKVPESALLGRFARMTEEGRYESPIANEKQRFFTMLGTLVGGRISVAAASVTAAKVGLAIALRYASERRQFGPALLDYPQHRRRLLPRLATTVVLSLAVGELQRRFTEAQRNGEDGVPTDTREIEASAAVLKALASTHAVETLAECRRACGGQGYLAVNRLPDLMNDVEIFTTFEGDNTVLLQLVAKSLLSGFKKRFASNGVAGVMRHLMKRAEVAATEKNVLAIRRAGSEHLRDAAFHLAALRYREERLLETAAQRFKKRLAKKGDIMEIQEHLVALAWAHADRLAFEWFDAGAKTTTGPLAEELGRLGALHALTRIRAEAGFYFSEGYLDPSKESAMRKETERLMRELRASARHVVDAFGIPDAALAAPIAFMDPAHPVW